MTDTHQLLVDTIKKIGEELKNVGKIVPIKYTMHIEIPKGVYRKVTKDFTEEVFQNGICPKVDGNFYVEYEMDENVKLVITTMNEFIKQEPIGIIFGGGDANGHMKVEYL